MVSGVPEGAQGAAVEGIATVQSSRARGSAPLVWSEDQVLLTCLPLHRSRCHSHHHSDLERTEPKDGAFRLPDLSPRRSELHS